MESCEQKIEELAAAESKSARELAAAQDKLSGKLHKSEKEKLLKLKVRPDFECYVFSNKVV